MVVRTNWGRASRAGTKSLVRTIVLGFGVCLGGLVLILRPGPRVPFGPFLLGPRDGPDGGPIHTVKPNGYADFPREGYSDFAGASYELCARRASSP